MDKGKTSPTKTDQLKRQSLRELIDAIGEDPSKFSLFWTLVGVFSCSIWVLGLLKWLSLIRFINHLLTENVMTLLLMFMFFALVCIPPIGYIGLISHTMPSKPVGRYLKHAFELTVLAASFIVHRYLGHEISNLYSCLAFVCLSHVVVRQLRHPADLDWSDWFFEAVMQVAVYVFGNSSKFGFVNLGFFIVLIGYRWWYYSCPQDHLPEPTSNGKSESEMIV